MFALRSLQVVPRVSRRVPASISAATRLAGIRTVTTKKFTPEHEWVSYDDANSVGTMSITDYAQKALGDVVYVELPAVGSQFMKGEQIGAVESVKAASDIYAPMSGQIVEINEILNSEPGLLNKDPEGKGWLCKIKIHKPEEFNDLLDSKAYKESCESH